MWAKLEHQEKLLRAGDPINRPEDAGCVAFASAREEAEIQEGAGGKKNTPIYPCIYAKHGRASTTCQLVRDVAFLYERFPMHGARRHGTAVELAA